jgi:multidrug efflux pump subunit AcrB
MDQFYSQMPLELLYLRAAAHRPRPIATAAATIQTIATPGVFSTQTGKPQSTRLRRRRPIAERWRYPPKWVLAIS